jgi:hypothetical protein
MSVLLHPDEKRILIFLLATEGLIKIIHGVEKEYPPANSLLEIVPWLYQGMAKEKDVGSTMILRFAAFLTLQYLIGQKSECLGEGHTYGLYDKRIASEQSERGSLLYFIELLQDYPSTLCNSTYTTFRHIGFTLLNVLSKPLLVDVGHLDLQEALRTPTWTPLSKQFWQALLNSIKDYEEVREDFRRLALTKLSEGSREIEEERDSTV